MRQENFRASFAERMTQDDHQRYRAPEFENERLSSAMDVFSFGMLYVSFFLFFFFFLL
jgi:hypothetical protein